jgi:hypothetical protein
MIINNFRRLIVLAIMGISVSCWAGVMRIRMPMPVSAIPMPTPTPASITEQEQNDEESRQIIDTQFLGARPSKKARTRSSPSPTASPRKPSFASGLVGVTVWRLRPAESKDTGARILEHKKDSDSELVAERVPSETKFRKGEKVRLSVETPQTGYLYVIDREQYADGSYSAAYLIFPTSTIRGGDNAVEPGRLIEIPDQDDDVPYFILKSRRADYVGEIITFLITSRPLPNLRITSDKQELSNELVSQWEQKWKAPAKRIELSRAVGAAYTLVEKAAGAGGANLLDQDDPPPQSIYSVTMKTADGLMITLPLLCPTASKSN